jgi:hypothetical protein
LVVGRRSIVLQDIGTFETISELAITLAGFTGIVVVFGPDRSGQPSEQFRFRALLYWSLGTAFLAQFPGLLLAYPDTLPVWRISHSVFAVFHLSVLLWFFAGYRRLMQSGDPGPPKTIRNALPVISAVSFAVLACELAVALGPAVRFGSFLYLLALLWFLFLAAFTFTTLLLPAAAQQGVEPDVE